MSKQPVVHMWEDYSLSQKPRLTSFYFETILKWETSKYISNFSTSFLAVTILGMVKDCKKTSLLNNICVGLNFKFLCVSLSLFFAFYFSFLSSHLGCKRKIRARWCFDVWRRSGWRWLWRSRIWGDHEIKTAAKNCLPSIQTEGVYWQHDNHHWKSCCYNFTWFSRLVCMKNFLRIPLDYAFNKWVFSTLAPAGVTMEIFKGKEIAADFIKLTLWQVLEYAELLNFLY